MANKFAFGTLVSNGTCTLLVIDTPCRGCRTMLGWCGKLDTNLRTTVLNLDELSDFEKVGMEMESAYRAAAMHSVRQNWDRYDDPEAAFLSAFTGNGANPGPHRK